MHKLAALILPVLCCWAHGQASKNVELLSNLAPTPNGGGYADLWGYRDPSTGKEYALLCSFAGLHVVDCSDPRAPVERGFIASENPGGLGNDNRDVKTYGSYAFVVSDAYGGMQIVDLSDPDNPVRATLWGYGVWGNAHNLSIDVETGIAYVVGTGQGSHVIDVSDPLNPELLLQMPTPLIHDLTVAGGFAYVADQSNNRFRIHDVTQLPVSMPLLSETPMPGPYLSHSAWPSRDGTIAITTNEAPLGPVAFWNVTNKRLPFQVGSYVANQTTSPMAVPHNPTMKDRVAHIGYYTEGYRVVDLTDPAQPIEVGYYDTWPGPSGGFYGAWGAYHDQPSGVIYVSDSSTGLYVLKPEATTVRYGSATGGSTGDLPEIHAFGAPFLGNGRFEVEVEKAPPSSLGVLLLGASRADIPVLGVTIHVALSAPSPLVISVSSNSSGYAAVPLPLPMAARLAGGKLDAQFLFADGSAPLGLAASQGLELELFDNQ